MKLVFILWFFGSKMLLGNRSLYYFQAIPQTPFIFSTLWKLLCRAMKINGLIMVCITPITPLHCQNNCWRNTERGFPQIFIVGSYLPRGKMKYFNRSFSVVQHKSNVKFDNTSCSWTSFLGFTSQHTTMGVYFTESRYGTEERILWAINKFRPS